ncbi:MAG: bifunctional DNA-formamidopyrimidine glycosylase/DNA-(apurinic or apyrimidinic site) lyase [Dehalococcoidia bacterium]
MPELPEVETIRRDLEPLVIGRSIVRVHVDPETLPLLAGAGVDAGALRTTLVGRRIETLSRTGKYLLAGLSDGLTLVIHLRMTGRLVWRPAGAPPEQYERARVSLDNGHDLRWSDLRKFGTWRLLADPAELLGRLGPEPIAPGFSSALFRKAIAGARGPIKSVLLDQRRLAGIGNIYADEALFTARVRPDTPADELAGGAVKRLAKACREVLLQGIANRGASFSDYVDGKGEAGSQHMHVQVFRRTGEPCYTCGSPVRRTVIGGRATHFCGRCQKSGKKRGGRGS